MLDRLNPLMEKGTLGLLINECGMGKDGLPRMVVPHKNFRVFLVADAQHGEISRAMRNRCVEIAMIRPPPPTTTVAAAAGPTAVAEPSVLLATRDSFQSVCELGVVDLAVASKMLAVHSAVCAILLAQRAAAATPRDLRCWASAFAELHARGEASGVALQQSYELAYACCGGSKFNPAAVFDSFAEEVAEDDGEQPVVFAELSSTIAALENRTVQRRLAVDSLRYGALCDARPLLALLGYAAGVSVGDEDSSRSWPPVEMCVSAGVPPVALGAGESEAMIEHAVMLVVEGASAGDLPTRAAQVPPRLLAPRLGMTNTTNPRAFVLWAAHL